MDHDVPVLIAIRSELGGLFDLRGRGRHAVPAREQEVLACVGEGDRDGRARGSGLDTQGGGGRADGPVTSRQASGNSQVRSIVTAHFFFSRLPYLPPIHHPGTTSVATGVPVLTEWRVCRSV